MDKTAYNLDNHFDWWLAGSANIIGDYRAAIKDYTDLMMFSSKVEEDYYMRGIAKGYLQDYKGAIEDYTKAIELAPKFANAYYNRGTAKVLLKDKKGALEDLSKAGELGNSKAYEIMQMIQA